MKDQKSVGFTLVELLVVIAIILILTAVAVVVYTGVTVKARDAARLADMDELNQAVTVLVNNSDTPALLLCYNTSVPCSGNSYPLGSTTLNTNGTGWVKVDFDSDIDVSFNGLPVDPTNSSTYNFYYCSDGVNWKFSTTLEYPGNQNLMVNDGGSDPNKYEVGSRLKQLSC